MAQTSTARARERFEADVLDLLPELYATALHLTRNETEAEDLVAEAVAKAWDKLATLEDAAAFRGWIFRIMTNAFISARRTRSTRPAHEPFVEEDGGRASFSLYERLHSPILLWWSNPEQRFLNRLLREDLEQAVAQLPEKFRVVVVLAHLQGFSYQEIADALDLPVGTVRSRLARGRARLQKSLWSHAVDAGLVTPDSPQQTKAP